METRAWQSVEWGAMRKSRGCTDQLFALRQIFEQRYSCSSYICLCFIDFRLALDLSEREQIYEIMRQYGLPAQVEKMRQNSCVGFQCLAKAGKTVGDTYKLRTWVRQGDVWSPFCFGLVIKYVLANSVCSWIDIGWRVADLDFCDDVTFFG